METLQYEKVYRLAMTNPIVHGYLKAYMRSEISWNDMLIEIITMLDEANRRQHRMLVAHFQRTISPVRKPT